MTEKELYRSYIIQRMNEKHITQVKASEILKISERQIRNLLKEFVCDSVKTIFFKPLIREMHEILKRCGWQPRGKSVF